MGIRSSDSIYQTVEKLLAKATKPMTCADLMDIPEMRDAAMKRFKADQQIATNKLSDTLGSCGAKVLSRATLLLRNLLRWPALPTGSRRKKKPK